MILCIPPRRNRTGRRKTWDEEHKERWRIERAFAWVGNFRQLRVCYAQLIAVYAAFFTVACILIGLRLIVKVDIVGAIWPRWEGRNKQKGLAFPRDHGGLGLSRA
ncbi:MAG: transposase [Candidatus Bipolaricaulota bacterium]|nr:transposase [Candidatus Bipolaricaulota bacterium]MDW8127320.1 transposase [Candidatus Bipolaricaulota bacterium]